MMNVKARQGQCDSLFSVAWICVSTLLLLTACGREQSQPLAVATATPEGRAVVETMETVGPDSDDVAMAPPEVDAEGRTDHLEDALIETGAKPGYTLPDFNSSWGLSRSVYDRALMQMDLRAREFKNQRYVVLIDFSKHASAKRFFLFDLETGRVEKHNVSHGKGSDPQATGYAKYFSNEPNSLKSSLGVYRTASTYQGKHGLQLRLEGLEASNSKALSRGIVVHSASYVSNSGRAGRSWGCPALDPGVTKSVINRIKSGALLLIWK